MYMYITRTMSLQPLIVTKVIKIIVLPWDKNSLSDFHYITYMYVIHYITSDRLKYCKHKLLESSKLSPTCKMPFAMAIPTLHKGHGWLLLLRLIFVIFAINNNSLISPIQMYIDLPWQ